MLFQIVMITITATTISANIIYFEGAHMPRSLCKFVISSTYLFSIHCPKWCRYRNEGGNCQYFKEL